MKQYLIEKCKNCSRPFYVERPSLAKVQKYCSKVCYGKKITKVENIVCGVCGKEFRGIRMKYCSNKCASVSKIGVPRTEETKKKIGSANKIAYSNPELRKIISQRQTGVKNSARKVMLSEFNPRWKGGITKISSKYRNCLEMKEWKLKILKRDNYTCQICNKRGGSLQVDHIIPFSFLLREALLVNNFNFLFDVSIGRVLCVACHRKTDTFSNKAVNHQNNKLIDLLERLWIKKGKVIPFAEFYEQEMDKIINKFKS